MAIQIIDNFLDKEEFDNIKLLLTSDSFPWFYHDYVSDKKDKNKFYFNHSFYNNYKPQSDFFGIWKNLLNKLEIKSLIRIKGNLHTRVNKSVYNNFHVDLPYKHKGCLLYINNNNGFTFFKESNKKVIPKENRVVLFDPSIEHKSSSCSNCKTRITVNINYI